MRRRRIFAKKIEKSAIFSNFEKRKRNLKFFSSVLRREREIWKRVLHFREEKEKWILFSQDSRGKGKFLPGFLKGFPFVSGVVNVGDHYFKI